MTETSSNAQPVVAINSSSSAVLQDAFRMKTVEMKHWTPLPDSMPSVCVLNAYICVNIIIYIFK